MRPTRSPAATSSPAFFAAHDAAGNQAGDLLEDHGGAVALHGDDVLFVRLGAFFAAGHVEFAFAVMHVADHSGDGGTIDVHVENIQENADALERGAFGFDGDHLAVGGRNGHRAGGDFTVGVAKEIEAEQRQDTGRSREPRPRQPGD
jgi:hypothetical protein